MTRQEAFDEINKTQDDYIDQLIDYVNDPANRSRKSIDFTSPTGTGKTKMMAKLINRFPDKYFIITTLSRGQLHKQISDSLKKDCPYNNFTVYGNMDYKINSNLQAEDILNLIPDNTQCIWLRDEGHIKTNKFEALLENKCLKIINFSATNLHKDIVCNFTHTMMLRTVNQKTGSPEDAIKKLLEVKEQHKEVQGYNPCAIFRCIKGDQQLYKNIIKLCRKYHLKWIDITDEEFKMAELCEDDNKYDVIINKFKLIEGIDIRRAHVLFMDSWPNNISTTIQVIGRCRRNALLYRDDVDILDPKNEQLLKDTRECYVFYNIKKMKVSTDKSGELCYAFCPYISCEALKTGATIEVKNGQLPNGLYIAELIGQTGRFIVETDPSTGFNIVNPDSPFYKTEYKRESKYTYVRRGEFNYQRIDTEDILKLPLHTSVNQNGVSSQYYQLLKDVDTKMNCKLSIPVSKEIKKYFKEKRKSFEQDFNKLISRHSIEFYLNDIELSSLSDAEIKTYIRENKSILLKLTDNNEDLLRWDTETTIFSQSTYNYLLYCIIKKYQQSGMAYKDYADKIDKILAAAYTLHISKDDDVTIKKIIQYYIESFY